MSFLASIKKLPNGIFSLDFLTPWPVTVPDDVAPDGAVALVLDLVRAPGLGVVPIVPLGVGKGGGTYGGNAEAEVGGRANVGKPGDMGVNVPRGGGGVKYDVVAGEARAGVLTGAGPKAAGRAGAGGNNGPVIGVVENVGIPAGLDVLIGVAATLDGPLTATVDDPDGGATPETLLFNQLMNLGFVNPKFL